MTWADFYLICFIVGMLLSVLALILGDMHIHLHLPFHIHLGHFHLGGTHAHGPGMGHGGVGEMPVINFGTITTFLAWFGGIGYLLTRHSNLVALGALMFAGLGGLVGASIVFFLLSKVLMRHEQSLDPGDYDMVGVLGRVTSSVAESGTGEIVYSQEGTRHTCGARSESGAGIAKGTEVVVTRYEKGIAYVRPWEEMTRTGEDAVSQMSKKV
jgi:membrane protein implicated in regulation of membrane protease activity